jgi:hypothetical protein
MRSTHQEFWKRVKYSFYSTLLFILITNPVTYRFTQTMMQGSLTILQDGIPTPVGYVFHSVFFFLTILSTMMILKN